MNTHPDSTAPAAPAERRAGDVRPEHAPVAALLMLLLALLGRAALPRCLVLLRRVFGALGRPRARAATPAQHRRALRQLRALPPRALYVRAHPFRASRAARRRMAACFRMLVMPPRRRPAFARPADAQHPRPVARHTFNPVPHARAGPSHPRIALVPAAPSHVHFVT